MQNTEELSKIQPHSSDGGFLQSSEWRAFQEKYGRKSLHFENETVWANGFFHQLPLVGEYYYIPRGPIILDIHAENLNSSLKELAQAINEKNAGWIRFDVPSEEVLDAIKNAGIGKVVKAPHDMQPKELFIMDISYSPAALLQGMKSKTRYDIRVGIKRGVVVAVDTEKKYTDIFLDLIRQTYRRHGITAHPEAYYRTMIETLPSDMLKLYIASYEGNVIAANLVLFYGQYATYLHGATADSDKNVKAAFVLQWKAMLDAKEQGCAKYDFGGVKFTSEQNDWSGITRFKSGFSQGTAPTIFPGTYDLILNPRSYALYRGLQRAKRIINRIRK